MHIFTNSDVRVHSLLVSNWQNRVWASVNALICLTVTQFCKFQHEKKIVWLFTRLESKLNGHRLC